MPARRDGAGPRDSPFLAAARGLLLGDAWERGVLRIALRGDAERLVVHLRLAVARVRALRRDVLFPVHAHCRASTRAGAPHACSTSGMTTEPSSCWPFSRIAIRCRQVTAVPLSVCTWRGAPPGPRWRMSSRRAWKSVVLEVEVTSRWRPWPGIQASQSYFLVAAAPRSSTAMLTTR